MGNISEDFIKWEKTNYYELILGKTKKEVHKDYQQLLKNSNKENAILRICQTYDLIFDQNIIGECRDISDYMRKIHSFKQYKDKKFKDSVINLESKSGYEVREHYHDSMMINGLNLSAFSYINDLKNLNSLNDLKLDLLSILINEQRLLLEKMKKALDGDNVGTYKNLVQALKDITYLVQREEDKIRYEKVYVEVGADMSYIYNSGKIYSFKGTSHNDFMIDKVKSLLRGTECTPIYLDTRGVGLCVYDKLKAEGYNVISAKTECQKCYQ